MLAAAAGQAPPVAPPASRPPAQVIPFSHRWRNRAASGRTRLNISFARAKMGEPAWKVWLFLVRSRDFLSTPESLERGEVWYGSARIAADLHFTPRKVRRALARLGHLGLVRARYNGEYVTPGWAKKRGALVYVRVVYGSLPLGSACDVVLVPRKAAELLKNAGRGGARPGAGRPRKEEGAMGKKVAAARNSKVGNPNSKAGTSREEDLDPLVSQEAKGAAAPNAAASLLPSAVGGTGAFLGGAATRQPIPDAAWRLLPPPPSFDAVSPPVVPPPPDLPDDPERDYEILDRAYAAAAEHVAGKAPSKFARKGTSLGALEKSLGACADKLREHRLPPILWAVWSMRTYNDFAVQRKAKRTRTKVRLPPMAWVFNPQRVEQHHGWCRSEMGMELGGTLCIPPSALELQRRWRGMRSEVERLHAPTVEAVVAVRDTWFKPGEYDALMEQAVMEAAAKREALAQGIAKGEWIW